VTIHRRRGSGTWWAWLGIALVIAIVIAALAAGFVEFR
jgi:hypothetical protein